MWTLATFNGSNGANPWAGLIMDGSGNLYGTTSDGSSYGTVFELAKQGGGYPNGVTTLASFNGSNGEDPFAGLIMDGSGDLYGTSMMAAATAMAPSSNTSSLPVCPLPRPPAALSCWAVAQG